MSLRLILMRHAKSDWSQPVSDYDRDLSTRGRASANAMANWLREREFIPEEALISTSKRTRKTFESLSVKPKRLKFLKELYHPSVHALMHTLKSAEEKTVILVSHNPAIGQFAESLAQDAPSHKRFQQFPTCATWVADFDIEIWEEAEFGTALTLDFAVPREVMSSGEYRWQP